MQADNHGKEFELLINSLRYQGENMKYVKPLVGSVFGAFVLLTGCHTFDSSLNKLNVTNPLQAAVTQSKENVLALVMAIHKAEMTEGQLAMKKATHRSVKRYAAHMYHEHSVGLKHAMQFGHKHGIKPVAGFAANKITTDANLEMANLKMLSGNAFDKAYIDYQVKDHADALHALDELIQKSTDPKLTQYLKHVREHVAHHLEKAKMIQKELAH